MQRNCKHLARTLIALVILLLPMATQARWISVDPKASEYPNISPYAYCANNPITNIDPDGEEIKIVGTPAQRQAVLSSLQSLTNDKLALKSDGTMIISKLGGENSGSYLPAGNSLIRGLNQKGSGSMTVTISVGSGGSSAGAANWASAQDGSGSNATVNFNPTANPQALTVNPATGKVSATSTPSQICLAHELIHASHINAGTVDLTKGTHTYQTESGSVTQTVRKEELRTVGLQGVRTGDVTENRIRKEQGRNDRGAY